MGKGGRWMGKEGSGQRTAECEEWKIKIPSVSHVIPHHILLSTAIMSDKRAR